MRPINDNALYASQQTTSVALPLCEGFLIAAHIGRKVHLFPHTKNEELKLNDDRIMLLECKMRPSSDVVLPHGCPSCTVSMIKSEGKTKIVGSTRGVNGESRQYGRTKHNYQPQTRPIPRHIPRHLKKKGLQKKENRHKFICDTCRETHKKN